MLGSSCCCWLLVTCVLFSSCFYITQLPPKVKRVPVQILPFGSKLRVKDTLWRKFQWGKAHGRCSDILVFGIILDIYFRRCCIDTLFSCRFRYGIFVDKWTTCTSHECYFHMGAFGQAHIGSFICDLFAYHTYLNIPNSRGLYTDPGFPMKGGMTIPNIRSLDPGTYDMSLQHNLLFRGCLNQTTKTLPHQSCKTKGQLKP